MKRAEQALIMLKKPRLPSSFEFPFVLIPTRKPGKRVSISTIIITFGQRRHIREEAFALVNAVIIAVAGGFIIFSKTARTTKHLAAIGIYVALGNVLFGIIMGET